MKRFLILLILIFLIAVPVQAMEFSAPEAPDAAQEFMPADTQSFGEGLWHIIKKALATLQPSIAEASGVCLSVIAVILLLSLLQSVSESVKSVAELAGALSIGLLLLKPANSLINLGVQTIETLNEYGKLLLPVMTTAMAAQGAATTSAALYTGTAIFNAVLSSMISKLLIPMIYILLCLCVANSAVRADVLKNLAGFVKWLATWSLKLILYLFTGYMSITGVVSGTADAAAVKAAKLAITGAVPIVGGIVSDASEAVLVGAGVMKSAVGVYGLLAILAIWIGPFLQIGVQYLLLKITASISGVFGGGRVITLLQDFTGSMGLLLAMTGTVCLLLLISTVCFMKGVA